MEQDTKVNNIEGVPKTQSENVLVIALKIGELIHRNITREKAGRGKALNKLVMKFVRKDTKNEFLTKSNSKVNHVHRTDSRFLFGMESGYSPIILYTRI